MPDRVSVVGPAPVEKLELTRYLGTWHQLAAAPRVFNLPCARDTRAEYRLDEQGDIAVRNTCVTWTGSLNQIEVTATVTDRVTGACIYLTSPTTGGMTDIAPLCTR